MDLTPFKNCLAHTNSIYISNEDEPYKPCCWFKAGIAANTVAEYREKLSSLDIATNCSHCIKQESSGATWSHRHLFNNPREFILGICFDNVCNLKCVTCSPMHSSQLIGEWDALGLYGPDKDKKHFVRIGKQAPKKIDFITNVLNNTDFDILKIEIFGGEPLINPLIFKFIDWVSEQPYANQTTIHITTNSTTYTDKIDQYCQKFKIVALQLSLDGIENTFEYLRYGTVWNETVSTIQKYYDLAERQDNFTLSFNYTLSWMNSMHFVDFYNWAIDNFPKVSLHLTKLEGPDLYNVDILSLGQREQLLKYTMDKLSTKPKSIPFEKMLDLYKQSMLTKFHDSFDQAKFKRSLIALKNKDNLRSFDYKVVLKPILSFIHHDTVRES